MAAYRFVWRPAKFSGVRWLLVAPYLILVAPRQILGGALILVAPCYGNLTGEPAQSTINTTVHSPSCALVVRHCELLIDDADGYEAAM